MSVNLSVNKQTGVNVMLFDPPVGPTCSWIPKQSPPHGILLDAQGNSRLDLLKQSPLISAYGKSGNRCLVSPGYVSLVQIIPGIPGRQACPRCCGLVVTRTPTLDIH